MPSSGQILNEITSRSGILSEHEQVSSYSHPMNNFSGFSDRLCKYDNFSPRGKTSSNNSKGQFIVGSKFSLYSKPVSVCGHEFSYSPSIKASAFVPQKDSTVNKQSFKQSWSKQETLLQSENPTKFSGSSELAMVGSRNATPLHSSSVFPTSRCENSNRLIFPGLGCNYGACQNSQSMGMERLWSHINKKELQTCFIALEYFVSHLRDIHVQLSVDNTAAVSHLNHAGGGTRSQALSDLAIATWEWCLQRRIYLSAIHIPGIVNKTPDGLSRQKLESTEWMLDSSVFRQIVAVYQQPQVDLFASHHNHQLPNYFSQIPDPQAMGTDAFSIPWKFNLCYLFPPFPLIQKCIQKIKQDQTDALLIMPVWKSRPWYPLLLEMLMDLTELLPLRTKLLHLPMFPSQVHPLIEKKINLAVSPVSGNPSKSEGFLKGCPKYCFLPGDPVQRNITNQHGNHLIAGVLRNRKIRFLAL